MTKINTCRSTFSPRLTATACGKINAERLVEKIADPCFNISPSLLAEEVAQGAFQRSLQRSPNDHERTIEQGVKGKAQRMSALHFSGGLCRFQVAKRTPRSNTLATFRFAQFQSVKTTKSQSPEELAKAARERSRPFTGSSM